MIFSIARNWNERPFRVSSSSIEKTDAPKLLDFDTIKKEEDLHETTISLSIIQYIPGSN